MPCRRRLFRPVSPAITREDAINLVPVSIATEELGLSHVINAQGEKLQYAVGTLPGLSGIASMSNVLAANESVRGVLEDTVQNRLFLHAKIDAALAASTLQGSTGATGADGATGSTGATGAVIYPKL